MTGPPAATAAVRLAVRRLLPADGGAAAVSGGPDSLALAAALAFELPGAPALVVDHQLQPGSGVAAARAAELCAGLGLHAVVLTPADLAEESVADHAGRTRSTPPAGAGGPEARARALRYALLGQAASAVGVAAVFLGHTRDDQAETVLLGLARGSGARALGGMAPVRGLFRRPLLDLPRELVRQACREAGLEPWQDPHNDDPSDARVRVRSSALPVLEAALGPGCAAALARSARLLREDADALDAVTPTLPERPDCQELADMAPALRARALKRWAEGLSGRPVTSAHVEALRLLVEHWSGQGAVALPGGLQVVRIAGHLLADPRSRPPRHTT